MRKGTKCEILLYGYLKNKVNVKIIAAFEDIKESSISQRRYMGTSCVSI
jgi:hypothetical protein